jgi:hypothetical protein
MYSKLPLVIDVSAVQMLLLTVTSWLDRREREMLSGSEACCLSDRVELLQRRIEEGRERPVDMK